MRVCHCTGTAQKTWRARFGKGALVSGFIGTATGGPLGGRPVQVMTAPDNGLGQWTQATTVTTAANGVWSAELPPGPSRLVEASYAGDSFDAPVTSSAVRLVVPAKVLIRITPRIVPWGGKITITGRVLGGYIPAGANNVLKLEFGNGPKPQTIGTPEIASDGHFTIAAGWSTGRGVVHYWFAVGTLKESGFPWAKGVSKHVGVTVGRPTPRASVAAQASFEYGA